MSNDTEFDFDAPSSAPVTLTDNQEQHSSGSGGGDEYASLDDVDPGSVAGPKKETACRGAISKPRTSERDGRTQAIIDFTVFQPTEFAGYTETGWFTVKGGEAAERKRDTGKLQKLCKSVGVSTTGPLSTWLAGLAKVAEAGREDVPFSLKPKNNNGHFVNP